QCASKKNGAPFRAVRAPDHHPVSVDNSAGFEFGGELLRKFHDLAKTERLGAIAALLPVGALVPMSLKILEEKLTQGFGHARSHEADGPERSTGPDLPIFQSSAMNDVRQPPRYTFQLVPPN